MKARKRDINSYDPKSPTNPRYNEEAAQPVRKRDLRFANTVDKKNPKNQPNRGQGHSDEDYRF